MVTYQWGIFWADLNPTKGSEQSGVRPVLVVSTEEANLSLPIVTVISLTSAKPGRKVYSIEAYLPSEISGLPKDSIAMAHQIRAVSKERLKDKCGYIGSEEYREKIRQAMMAYLDLV
ncbi:type II toxin-antitoxin system PemK/MazF family toxin [Microaerobacter geothermalis]|uniref:type II toxin-antitoxin system PemK/MazF family toxin n=1 Tax=Microaerobacter geothermalis TaxID=674972 RepID=UPI001F3EECE8|nr:type II toxin-antitoxin system PemK/MazF family toxin [Microaerobacter geothermalis]MCF6093244.1 type II toxin-antitoxin system PemK/MazF family toxin [Microaerobacter geothermalis]